MTLTQAQRDKIAQLVEYLEQGSANSPDGKVAEELARIFSGNCGLKCGCWGDFLEEWNNAPITLLLKVMLCGDEGLIVPPAA
jgi:hypothetical protein